MMVWNHSEPAAAGNELRRQHKTDALESKWKALAIELNMQLKAGGRSQNMAVNAMCTPGTVKRLAFEPDGCRTLQLALDSVGKQMSMKIAVGLQGCVRDAVCSPHANFVIQKVIKVMTPQEVPFL